MHALTKIVIQFRFGCCILNKKLHLYIVNMIILPSWKCMWQSCHFFLWVFWLMLSAYFPTWLPWLSAVWWRTHYPWGIFFCDSRWSWQQICLSKYVQYICYFVWFHGPIVSWCHKFAFNLMIIIDMSYNKIKFYWNFNLLMVLYNLKYDCHH